MEVNFVEYIVKEAYVLIPVLYIIGYFLKNTPAIPNWCIPWILMALGIVGGLLIKDFSYAGVIQGILVSGLTVMTNQLYVQTAKRVSEKKQTDKKDE